MKSVLGLIFSLFVMTSTKAQYIAVDDTYTAQQLVEDVFIGVDNLGCIDIFNAQITNWFAWGPQKSYGYFNRNNSSFQLDEGVLLTTGRAVSAIGPNTQILSEGPAGNAWPGDPDLEQALGINNTVNATALEFDFIAHTNTIQFDYIFASEQYLTSGSSNQCNYTDGFAFLIKRANSDEMYTNLAVVPSTDIPVAINTVRGSGGLCPGVNEQYFESFNEEDHPINYNGQTKILTAQTNIIAGEMYHIKLVIADQGNNLYDSAVFLKGGSFSNGTKNLGTNRLVSSGNPICQGNSFEIDATTPNATSYNWYKNDVLISGATHSTYQATQTGNYSVEIGFSTSGCLLKGAIQIEFSTNPIVSNTSLIQCENQNGTTYFNLKLAENKLVQNPENYTIIYFENFSEAENNTQNRISNPQNYNPTSTNQKVYVRVENSFGCHTIAEINLSTLSHSLQNPSDINSCNDTFDLTLNQSEVSVQSPVNATYQYFENYNDALLGNNEISNITSYKKEINTTIYVRISKDGNCYGIVWFDLVERSINVDLSDENVFICNGETAELSVVSGFSDYLWNNGQSAQSIQVNQPGIYTVTITNNFGCIGTKMFVVDMALTPIITSIDINDMNSSGNNTIQINTEEMDDYEYSLDGVNYQKNYFFVNVFSGEYNVSVRGFCGTISQQILVLDYPKFFTPNGDGINDYWKIPTLSVAYPKSRIQIFDRYGKLLTEFSAETPGWDGTFNAQKLPATDYWFVIKLPERTVKGHFSLIR